MEKKQNQETSLDDKKKISAQSGVIVAAIILLCYFFGFSYIWNSGYGSEVSVNGWNYIISCLTWNFKGTGALYGDIAVPFNYYAKYYVRVLSISVTVTLAILIIFTSITVFNIVKFRKKLEIVSMILLYVLAFSFLVCVVVALTMNGSSILSKYCNSNPKCSIATLAFFPFFVSLIAAIIHSVFIYKNEL